MSIDSQNEFNTPSTLAELVWWCESRFADVRAVFAPHVKPIVELTYSETAEEIAVCGAGLLQAGIEPGQHIALFSDNRPRWLMSDLAIACIGAVDVPRGSDTSTGEFEFILEHSGCVAAFVQDRKLYNRLFGQETFRKLKFVVLMDDAETKPQDTGPTVYKYQDILDLGREHREQYDAAAKKLSPSTVATIVYTSGTTGSPKGVVLTHGNLLTQPVNVDLGLQPEPGEILLSILPAWHAYERAVEYFGMYHGVTIAYSDKKYIREDLLKFCPHLLPCVPRIWEAIYKGIQTKVSAGPEKKQRMFRLFMQIGTRYVHARRVANNLAVSRTPISAAKRVAARGEMAALFPAFKLGDSMVFSKIRNVTGGRMRAAISGGGSLAPYLDDFFEIVGVPILNGYGLTETAPVLSLRTVDHNVRGTVGRPMKNTILSIRNENGAEVGQGETGHIWAKGPQIMQEYYKNPEATSKVINADGWFITGDIGWITETGDLVITGRAKDTIVLSSGENVEPDPIENVSRKSPLVQQIVVIGQDRKSLAALVVPEFAALAEALELSTDLEPEEIVKHQDAAKLVKQSIAEAMAADGRFKASESVGKVHLLAEPFSESNEMMTSTMKIKRNVVLDRFSAEIDALYA